MDRSDVASARLERSLRASGLTKPIDFRSFLPPDGVGLLLVGAYRLGDLLVMLPALEAISDEYGEAHITVAAGGGLEDLLRQQPFVDDVVELPGNESSFYRLARRFHGVLAPRRFFPAPAGDLTFPPYVSFTYNMLWGNSRPVHLQYLDALRVLGIEARYREPRVRFDSKADAYGEQYFQERDLGSDRVVVGLHGGSGDPAKRWAMENYEEVARWLVEAYDAYVVLVEGPSEGGLHGRIVESLGPSHCDLCREMSVPELAAVLSRCTFYLGNDTGVMHLADSVGIPSVVIFGPSRPRVWGPCHPASVTLVREDIWRSCLRCAQREKRDQACRHPADPWCLKGVSADDVVSGIESMAALAGLRGRFPDLDSVKVASSLQVDRVGEDGLIVTNLRSMRPLVVQEGGRRVEACLAGVEEWGSYRKVAEADGGEGDVGLLDALLSFRLVVPGGEREGPLEVSAERERRAVLADPLAQALYIREDAGYEADFFTDPEEEERRFPLRILLVNSAPFSMYGGTTRWMVTVGAELRRRGHEVLCWGQTGHAWLRDASNRGLIPLASPLPLSFELGNLPDRVRHLRQLGLDAVILAGDREVIPLAGALRMAGVKRVYARKGLAGFDDRDLTRRTYELAVDGIIVPSAELGEDLARSHGIPTDRLHVIPNAIDSSRFDGSSGGTEVLRRDLDIPATAPVLLTVGRLARQKGLPYLLDALPGVLEEHTNTILLMVGRGPDGDHLSRQAQALGIADSVRFLGMREDVERFLAMAEVFVLPSLYEGMSTSLLEAMAAGVPVVATEVFGSTECVEDGRTGLLVPPGSSRHLEQAIIRLLGNPQWAREMGSRGREFVRRHHALPSMIDALENLLKGRPLP